ncbi:MAG: hypothetical protein DHS20C11_31620 [Lysobacteraceae bacterium]|nr:MAG: hypothetical protein DHS20C11_31620 [Xanthomonadaceae bacterium]
MADAMTEEQEYLLGTDHAELMRLGFQHRVWAAECASGWQQAGFSQGQKILDLGCGPGFASLDLAYIVGNSGRVLAVDESARFIKHLQRRSEQEGFANIESKVCRVEDLKLKPNSLDGIHVRWLLCFLDQGQALIKRLAQALKPGGTLLVFDYFDYRAFSLAPRSKALDRIVEAIQTSWRQSNGSLDVQGDTGQWCAQAGLDVLSIENKSNTARPGSLKWRWPEVFLRGYLPYLETNNLIDADTVEDFWGDWTQREKTDGSYLILPPLLEIIARKPGT